MTYITYEFIYSRFSYEDAVVDSLRWRHQQHLVDRDIFQPYFSSPNVFKDIMERGLCYVSHYTDNARRALIYFRVARYMPVNASRSPSTLETYNELIALTVERCVSYPILPWLTFPSLCWHIFVETLFCDML